MCLKTLGRLYLSESLKDGFQHLFTNVVMEGPNVEFLWPLSFLQVLGLGCKSEERVEHDKLEVINCTIRMHSYPYTCTCSFQP